MYNNSFYQPPLVVFGEFKRFSIYTKQCIVIYNIFKDSGDLNINNERLCFSKN